MWRGWGDARTPFPPVPGGRIFLPRAAQRPTRDGAAGHPENRIPCPRDRTTKDRLAMLECRHRWHGAESIPVKSEISVVLEWDPDVHLET